MKIGITCYPTHGGSGVVASELAIGLAERGHEVHVVSYATPFRVASFHENVFVHEVEIASYPLFKYPPYALALATKLVDLVRAHDLDLIHSHYAVPHATSAYLAQQILAPRPIRTVTTLHGTDITLVGLDSSFFQVIRFAIQESDAVTAVSDYLKRRTIEEFGVGEKIEVLHNFVDGERYRPDSNRCTRSHFAEPHEKLIMHASNFRPVKRVGDVIRSFALIIREVPSRLLLVGEGPERLLVQHLVKELKLSDSIRFLGQQDDLESLLPCADLFLLPSEQESFGLVALEANACGVPVVAAETGGLPELIADGQNGYLVPVGDTAEMARRSVEILRDDALSRRLRSTSRRIAVERFNRTEVLSRYEELYRRVLSS